jgi:HPt (histidine-containing phosphotransfer) domain-containing protein
VSTAGSAELDAAIAALWQDAQPRALARVEIMERATAALASGALDAELADEARRDAHKLAGSLGTFGMPEGTVHARAIELRLEAGVTPADAAELGEHVAGLRAVVEGTA